MGKDIIFAGTRDTWERWRGFFESRGLKLHLAEVIVPMPSKDLEGIISSLDPMAISSAIFTSKSSVKILMSSRKGKELLEELHQLGSLVTATGEGTASILSSYGYKAFSPPVERVETLLKILSMAFRRGEIVIFSSDGLEIPSGDLTEGIKRIEVYELKINREGVMMLENMLRGVERIIVASQTASKALCMAKDPCKDGHVEIHAMTERVALPLLQCRGGGFKLIIYNSDTFRDFIKAIIDNVSSTMALQQDFAMGGAGSTLSHRPSYKPT